MSDLNQNLHKSNRQQLNNVKMSKSKFYILKEKIQLNERKQLKTWEFQPKYKFWESNKIFKTNKLRRKANNNWKYFIDMKLIDSRGIAKNIQIINQEENRFIL